VPNKEVLVQLAYQYIVPQPQRKYRANRRGLAMTAKQRKRASALKALNYHDGSASQTYTMYVCMLLHNGLLQKDACCMVNLLLTVLLVA